MVEQQRSHILTYVYTCMVVQQPSHVLTYMYACMVEQQPSHILTVYMHACVKEIMMTCTETFFGSMFPESILCTNTIHTYTRTDGKDAKKT
jgi:hypothetical protein